VSSNIPELSDCLQAILILILLEEAQHHVDQEEDFNDDVKQLFIKGWWITERSVKSISIHIVNCDNQH